MKPILIPEEAVATLSLADYTIEPKFDGWRAIVTVTGKVRLWTRERRPIAIPEKLQEALEALKMKSGTVLDGEIWNPSKRGGWLDPEGEGCRLTLWDCIQSGSETLGKVMLEDRRSILEEVVKSDSELISLVEMKEASLENLLTIKTKAEEARENGARSGFIHGAVLKRKGSIRRDHPKKSAEDASWMKVVFQGMKGWEPR